MVSVDGADAVDNSINAIRSTLSQEGIQEFQLILSNYNAEYGRASGGVINIVSKSGTNEFHGNALGTFAIRLSRLATPFLGKSTRSLAISTDQAGLHAHAERPDLRRPAQERQDLCFFSYEYTQREESGFASIASTNSVWCR